MINQQPAKRNWRGFGLLGTIVLWTTLVFGQTGTRDISGTVTDHEHEPLKGAVIQVENSVTLMVESFITDRDGKYRFRHLEGGTDYRVWVEFRGHRSKVRQLSKFDDNKPKAINFVVDLR